MHKEIHIQWEKNTSLQSDIQKSPELAAQMRRKYPKRFAALAGPNYRAPAPAPQQAEVKK
jgi:hypothetical protein